MVSPPPARACLVLLLKGCTRGDHAHTRLCYAHLYPETHAIKREWGVFVNNLVRIGRAVAYLVLLLAGVLPCVPLLWLLYVWVYLYVALKRGRERKVYRDDTGMAGLGWAGLGSVGWGGGLC